MRGAAIDAECPRCGHKQPPGDAIVTCTRCGLAYPPKEIQHRVSRRRDEDLPALGRPAAIEIDEVGDTLTFRWNPHGRSAGVGMILGAIVVSMIIVMSLLSTASKIAYLTFCAGLAIYGVHRTRTLPQVWLDRKRVQGRGETILLADISQVGVQGNVLVVVTHDGSLHGLALAPDDESAAYVADALVQRLPASPDETDETDNTDAQT